MPVVPIHRQVVPGIVRQVCHHSLQSTTPVGSMVEPFFQGSVWRSTMNWVCFATAPRSKTFTCDRKTVAKDIRVRKVSTTDVSLRHGWTTGCHQPDFRQDWRKTRTGGRVRLSGMRTWQWGGLTLALKGRRLTTLACCEQGSDSVRRLDLRTQ